MSSPDPSRSSPRVAVVTGAGSGIGRACANALLAEGWSVVYAGRRLPTLQASIDEAAAAGLEVSSRTLAVPTDVTDPASVAALFDAVDARFGRIDLLFNNAGSSAPAPVDELPFERWREVLDANVTGTFLCTQQAFRRMKRQQPRGGRIVNNGSISAHVPRPNSVAYTASKHAITGITKAAALDGRALDIAVGQIDIGNAATDMTIPMRQGVLQPDGSVRAEAVMDVKHVADALIYLSRLPLDANVPFMTVMATAMPYLGRG